MTSPALSEVPVFCVVGLAVLRVKVQVSAE